MAVRYVNFELGKGAKAPYKKHIGDAGWDLYVIKIDMPPYLYARIVGRSSTLRKHGLLVNEGIIDNGYTGELFVGIHNMTEEVFHAKKGMRLAQVLFHNIEDVRWSQVEKVVPTPGKRGDSGFGSTGE